MPHTEGLASIAFPAISTGVYGYPKDEAAQIAITTICEHVRDKVDDDFEVWLVAFDTATEELYRGLVEKSI